LLLYYDNKSGVENRMSKMIFKTPNKLVTNFCLHFESKVNWIIIVMKMRIAPGQYQNENVELLNKLVKKVV
ncbi:hypothetical protein, partial [Staphylococcus warneri]|uniref:hypothetical protein n=1 Tax=Staphylococcus warneri TaxID=1292 RepID=UPI003F16C973